MKKNKKYHNVVTIPKLNIYIIERDIPVIETPNTQIHDHSLSKKIIHFLCIEVNVESRGLDYHPKTF
jgi:hypothetical protein